MCCWQKMKKKMMKLEDSVGGFLGSQLSTFTTLTCLIPLTLNS